jgi:hypothetical protein
MRKFYTAGLAACKKRIKMAPCISVLCVDIHSSRIRRTLLVIVMTGHTELRATSANCDKLQVSCAGTKSHAAAFTDSFLSTYILNSSMQQNSFSEAIRSSASLEFPHILWQPECSLPHLQEFTICL